METNKNKENKKDSLGARIQRLRKEKGMTQAQLASHLNLTDKAISKWEAGDGNPDISLLPAIAQHFDVSVDYLLTGKELEEKVIIMSKIELCAKTDDINCLKAIHSSAITDKDDSEKNILDYCLQYDCPNVVNELLGGTKARFFLEDRFRGLYREKVVEILIKYGKYQELKDLGVFKPDYIKLKGEGHKKIALLESALKDTRKNRKLIDQYLAVADSVIFNKTLEAALDSKDMDLFNSVLNDVIKINDKSTSAKEKDSEKYQSGSMDTYQYIDYPNKTFEAVGTSRHYYYFVVKIPRKIIKYLLIELKDFERGEKLNKMNAAIGGESFREKEIAIVKMRLDKTFNSDEVLLAECTSEYGVLRLTSLVNTGRIDLIKKAIFSKYITNREMVYKNIISKNYKTLFEFLIDSGSHNEASYIAEGKIEELKRFIQQDIYKDERDTNPSSKNKYFEIEKEDIPADLADKVRFFHFSRSEVRNNNQTKTRNFFNLLDQSSRFSDAIDINVYLSLIEILKAKIIARLEAENERKAIIEKYENSTKEITKDYIQTLVKEGQSELAIIKLCAKLESKLRIIIDAEDTDFNTLISTYTDKHLILHDLRDDEDNRYREFLREDDETREKRRLLHKLRITRNGIAHPDSPSEKLSFEELERCIDIVFSITEKR